MRRKRIQQIKAYSKIIKYKKNTGEVQEVCLKDQPEEKQTHKIEEEQDIVEVPQNQEFEDPFEDQYEKQEGWISDESSNQQNEEESGTMISEKKEKKKQEQQKLKDEVFLGTNKNLSKGEVLEFDNKAYDMLHRLNIEWPSLSIDFICKNSPFESNPLKFQQMKTYPYEVYTIQGSCNNTNKNSLYFSRWTKLHQTKFDDDPDCEEESANGDEDPEIIIQELETTYDINRIKTLNNSPVVAFWNDNAEIHIVDLASSMQKLKNGVASKKKQKSNEIVIKNETSGFALNWNPHKIGELATGNLNGVVQIYNNNENYTSWVETSQYLYHKGSVEDIIFSPEQAFVFASCSSDRTLQIVDMRVNNYKKSALKINAHSLDVNVCDWNKMAAHLIVTGSDDCKVKVWDLRMSKDGSDEELLCFNWHTEPITSIKFQPNEQSVIAVASEDNRLSLWDMSMENEEEDPEVPNQLMFLHQGQQEIKQICFHPIYYEMIVSTSIDSINIFKPALEMPEFDEDEKADLDDLKKPPIREEELDKYLQRMSLN